MADAFTSALVDQLVSRAIQKIEKEVALVKNVKDDVKRLKKRVGYIQDLLVDAGSRQLDSNWLKHWLSDLEDLSYNIDDVLDEWNSAILKSQIEKEQEGGDGDDQAESSVPGTYPKTSRNAVRPMLVLFRVPSSCFCLKKANDIIRHRHFAKRMKELNEKLDNINKEGQNNGLVLGAIRQCSQQLDTTSSVVKPKFSSISLFDESTIQGREEDRRILVNKLLGESRKGIDIIPIVGMGGLGKTTLAQLAYDDDRVKTHFEKRIWVCVSDPFDQIRIAKAIIKGLGGKTENCEELEDLVQSICNSIQGRKFLLVLDDVWTEEEQRWEQLKLPLMHGAIGSRILVTTRKEEVAKMMGALAGKITPKILLDEQCWAIMKQLAFEEGEDKEVKQLEDVGIKIASKCKGLPLVAKVLGGLMMRSCNKSKSKWENILHSKLWESKAIEDQIFAPLLLSYYDLSPSERCCFSYCSIFPKDHEIEREMLIDLWMSQGYVGDFRKGQECFEILVMRSFFQDFKNSRYSEDIISCKMHDIMHDFAQFLTKDKSVIIEGDDTTKEKMKSHHRASHLTLVNSNKSDEFLMSFKDTGENTRLRTFLFFPEFRNRYGSGFASLNSIGLRSLRISIVHGLDFATLIHLRYLEISHDYRLTMLPETLCDLCNLQTLKMNQCSRLERLPKGIGKLVNLRNLYIYNCELEGLPKGIGKLSLERLDKLLIPKNNEAYFHFGDLKKGNHYQLRGSLRIDGCINFRNVGEAEKANLIKMKDLEELELYFGENIERNALEPQHEFSILEALQPHPDLKSLSINLFAGTDLYASWMTSLNNLRCLTLANCPNCEILPPLGKFPYLESLTIAFMKRLKKVGAEFLGIPKRDDDEEEDIDSFISFPKLKKLWFSNLCLMKEWEGSTADFQSDSATLKVMPCLRELIISDCGSLEALPDFLRVIPLQRLEIYGCTILEVCFQRGRGEERLNFSHIPNIQITHRCVKKNGIWIQQGKFRRANCPGN